MHFSLKNAMKAIDEATLDDMVDNSYKNFHSKGLSYVCLSKYKEDDNKRFSYYKLYVFDGDVSKLSEVVNPHDHRYDFLSYTMKGAVANRIFEENRFFKKSCSVYNKFKYMTPLNGGNGFEWEQEVSLFDKSINVYAGQSWWSRAEEIHTLDIRSNQAMLLIYQAPDLLSTTEHTVTYVKEKEPPSLTGLYDKFKTDELISLLQLAGLEHLLYKRKK